MTLKSKVKAANPWYVIVGAAIGAAFFTYYGGCSATSAAIGAVAGGIVIAYAT